MIRAAIFVASSLFVGSLSLSTCGCKTGADTPATDTASEANTRGLGCDHEVAANSTVKHTWPYPAEYRDLRWIGGYRKMALKLRPTHAAFVTATVTWSDGDVLKVQDSQIRVLKPRRLIAKRDLFVRRREWSQGIEVEKTYLAVRKGEVGSFLLYNSRGLCLVGFDEGAGWTPCTLDDAFEGLSADDPHPCEQEWWVLVQRRKLDKGWMIVDPALMERVAAEPVEAR
jgi:hypothetical protein